MWRGSGCFHNMNMTEAMVYDNMSVGQGKLSTLLYIYAVFAQVEGKARSLRMVYWKRTFSNMGPQCPHEDQLRSEWGWCWLLGHHVSTEDIPWNSLLGDGEWVLQPCPYQLCLLPRLQMFFVSGRNGFDNIRSWSREMSGMRDWWVDCDIGITLVV